MAPTRVRSGNHFFEKSEAIFDRAIPTPARQAFHSLVCKVCSRSVIGVGISVQDHLLGVLFEHVEVAACVCNLVCMNAQKLEIRQDRGLELFGLGDRICIIGSNDQLPLISFMSEVVIQDGGFCMTDMKISAQIDEIQVVNGEAYRLEAPDRATYDGSRGNLVTTPRSVSARRML